MKWCLLLLVLMQVVLWQPPAQASAADPDSRDAQPACLYESAASDGSQLCIRKETYGPDLCRAIEHYAAENALPPEFFARLIWRESLFRPEAVSYRGAEGIAQFMPGTARLRGLGNSFHVLDALSASARYLGELRQEFGNLGFAAAAYNAGENGLRRFIDKGRLPLETRDYVFAITGQPVERWKDDPPERAAPPLDEKRSFAEGCVQLASTRRINEPVLAQSADWAPWGVQLAANYDPGRASRSFTSSVARLPAPLNAERALLVRQKMRKFGPRPRYAARIGRETQKEALRLCSEIRNAGGACIVLKN